MFPAETTASDAALRGGATGREERAVPLVAGGVGRLLVHSDDLRRIHDLEIRRERLEQVPRPEQHRLDLVRQRLARARDDLVRRVISAHRIDGDSDTHASLAWFRLGRGRLERLDLAAPIGSAGRADVMRALGLVAMRALDERLRPELVLGATLVAARLRRLSLGNSHEPPEYTWPARASRPAEAAC